MTKNLAVAAAGGLDRRQFMIGGAAAGGLFYAFSLPLMSRGAEAAVTQSNVTAWVKIGTDESIVINVGVSEMGQGISSGVAQVLAEELMVDWSKVQVQFPPANLVYANPLLHSQGTFGSFSMRGYFQPMRVAGATVRDMLRQAAANTWGVPLSSCAANSGAVSGPNSRVLTYGQLAAAASALPPPANPPLLGTGQLIGTPVIRTDLAAKVQGKAVFGIDVQLPGMLYAGILHCPVVGGTYPAGYTPRAPRGAVAVVPLDNAVAVVVNTNTWDAIRTARGLTVPWVLPPDSASTDSVQMTQQAQNLMAGTGAATAESVGNAAAALAGAKAKIDITFSAPYLAHACMEVLNCTAQVTATSCTIWAPTQAPTSTAATAAALTGLPPSAITVNTTFLGGGLGRKIEQDYISQAIRIAKAVNGKPVKLVWSREEDFSNDVYRPMALSRVQAGLDAQGNVVAWSNRIVSPSISYQRNAAGFTGIDSIAVGGATKLGYSFGTRLVEYIRHPSPVPVGYWRSIGNSVNCFVVESAIDELAKAAGEDPLEFRQALLAGDARSVAVLDAVAELGNWGGSLSRGHAQGLAFSNMDGTLVAQIAEISKTTGGIKVHRIAAVIDCGPVVNPDSVKAQVEGSIVHGMTAALWGQMTFTAGKANVRNFNNYRMMRLRDMPVVDVTILPSSAPVGGVGEPAVPPTAPALANAYAKLTGTRIATLPMFPQPPGAGGGD